MSAAGGAYCPLVGKFASITTASLGTLPAPLLWGGAYSASLAAPRGTARSAGKGDLSDFGWHGPVQQFALVPASVCRGRPVRRWTDYFGGCALCLPGRIARQRCREGKAQKQLKCED